VCTEFSQNADLFPEGLHFLIWLKFAASSLLQTLANRLAFLVVHDVNAGSPRQDFARDLDQFLLILLRPRADAL